MLLDNIKYITFTQLMSSVESDLDSFADSGMVDRSKYIKIIRKVNAELGLRINKEKEIVLEIKNHRAYLPDDFENLQLALLCEEIPSSCSISPSADAPKFEVVAPCRECNNECSTDCTTLCTSCYKIYEYQAQDLTITYTTKTPVKLTKKSYQYCSDNCLNTMLSSDKYKYTLDVNERVITLSGIKEGKIYINYLTDMVSDDNEILIVDHPLLNDYYEYSVKEKLLENFLLNSDSDVSQKLKYVMEQKRIAKGEAMNFINMREYTEIVAYQKAKRENFYNRYFKAFERY
jgi:hypothetical protein